jgi:hypothetical protein
MAGIGACARPSWAIVSCSSWTGLAAGARDRVLAHRQTLHSGNVCELPRTHATAGRWQAWQRSGASTGPRSPL